MIMFYFQPMESLGGQNDKILFRSNKSSQRSWDAQKIKKKATISCELDGGKMIRRKVVIHCTRCKVVAHKRAATCL